jgi:hypothetical protein
MLTSSPTPPNLDRVIEDLEQSQEPTITVAQELEIPASHSFSLFSKMGLFFKTLIVLISTTFKLGIN